MRYCLLFLILSLLPPDATADTKIEIEYHAPTDLFQLMDAVTGWYFNDPSYRAYWKNRFGWSSDDRRISRRYKSYRNRTYDRSDQKNRSHIFATKLSTSQQLDPLAEHFVNAASIDEALSAFEDIASPRDAAMLRSFYDHFEENWRTLLRESAGFVGQAKTLDRELRQLQTDAYLNRLSSFFRVDEKLVFKARFVWWPPIDRTLADVSGQIFFLRRHPQKHKDSTGWLGVIMHEVAHHVSSQQTTSQKQTLSKAFLEVCPIKMGSGNTLKILEEPLAVAWGQAAFVKYVRNETPDPGSSWYSHPFVEIMGRLLWLHLDKAYETEETITDGILVDVAVDCERLHQSQKILRTPRLFGN